MRLRLRTQLLIAIVLISSGLTAASLFVVQHSIHADVRRQTELGTASSIETFKRIQRRQEAELYRTAALLAELPTLKAVMPADPVTVQDASSEFWKLSGSDLLILASPAGQVMAVHVNGAAVDRSSAADFVAQARAGQQDTSWWHYRDSLYQVVLRPIVSGRAPQEHLLGTLVLGRRIDAAVAQELSAFVHGEAALVSGDSLIATTFTGATRQQLVGALARWQKSPEADPDDAIIDGHKYDVAVVELHSGTPAIRCYLLIPLDPADAFLRHLHRTILALGIFGVVIGALLATVMAKTITRPIENLVAAVRAFARGEYSYPMAPAGGPEVRLLGNTFNAMRQKVVAAQRREVEAARLAALGRAAGSISHDLRHHLAAVVANAEFLYDADKLGFDRDECYREVQRASEEMTELIDSLIEVSRDKTQLSPAEGILEEVALRAAEAVRANPDFRGHKIEVRSQGSTTAMFDSRKLERAFFNLILNACQATSGRVSVQISGDAQTLECRVSDDGPGIPEDIRDHLFEPFVSSGKTNGSGLGLAIASKVVHDHGGEIRLESTSKKGTVILIRLPRKCTADDTRSEAANQPT